jgi:MMP 1-O-methyltransferase
MNAGILDKLSTVSEYALLELRFSGVQGWMSGVEGYALMLMAAHGPGAGEIVEIGSWMGKSACWLAAGSKSARREKVHAIDPFDGGPMLKDHPVIQEQGTTYHAFVDNLTSVGLFDYVEPIVATSQQAFQSWGKPIRLLFIDGDHSFDAVKCDFETWSRFLIPEALIAFDDVTGGYEGAKRYYDALLQGDRRYREIARVGKMKFIQRLA